MDILGGHCINIMRLRADDESVEKMRVLNQLYGTEFEDPESYESNPSKEYLESLLADEHIIVLAAMDEERIVGGLTAYILPKPEQERSEIYIYDLAVGKNYRRKGIATSLIEEIQNIGESVGAWAIFVQGDPEDLPAIKLYESLGIKEDVFHFDILDNKTNSGVDRME